MVFVGPVHHHNVLQSDVKAAEFVLVLEDEA